MLDELDFDAAFNYLQLLRKRCPTKWLLSEDDRQIHPEAQRWMAERM